ncbi:MAG TPA: T9SS type A sorting domain-containing protein [Cytophagales bacterium]|nr:T9SS type A sorting domain-containing protein [Cytophagales bacterium]
MRQILRNVFSVIYAISEKANVATSPKTAKNNSLIYSIAFSLLLFFLMSTVAVAGHHFKGGYFTYTDLGGGKYDFFVNGYWDKDAVSSLYPRFGIGASYGFSKTVSKTLLSDGETVEHIQKFTVTWSTPGLKQINYDVCCMGDGSNFDHNTISIFVKINVDPTTPNSSPQFYDFPIFNFSEGQPLNYKMDYKDPEGHEQEFSLQLPSGKTDDVYNEMIESGFQLQKDGRILWENPIAGQWEVIMRLSEKINGVFTGVYIDRIIIITVTPPIDNLASVFTPVQSKLIRAGQPLSFEVEATDTEDQSVTLTAYGAPFEAGASFSQHTQGSIAKGTFTWTPPVGTLGTYRVQFVAADNYSPVLYSRYSVDITVADCMGFAANYSAIKPCAGSNNGKITLNSEGGYGPYKYSIDNGVTFQSLATFENLAPGNYLSVIEDVIGCRIEQNVALEENPLPVITLNLPSVLCDFNALALSGSPEGGSFYGTGVENGFFYPETTGAGTYTINYSYTNTEGCSNTASHKITVNQPLLADAGEDVEVFTESNSDKKRCAVLTGTVTGGRFPYMYEWSNGETTQSIDVCPTESTTYLLTVTDALGCSITSDVEVAAINAKNGNGKGKDKDSKPGKGGSNARIGSDSADAGIETMDAEVVIFPNPVNDQSQVKVISKKADKITIDIIDLSGRTVKQIYSGNIEANQEITSKINHEFKDNLYILRVKMSDKVSFQKLMIR